MIQDSQIPDLFSIDYQKQNQLEAWLKVTPEKIRNQRNIVLKYLEVHPCSTYEEIYNGLISCGVKIKMPSVVRTLSYLKKEKDCPLDLTGKKGGATAYRLKGNND